MTGGAMNPPSQLVMAQPAFHCDPGDKADTLRAALFMFVIDHDLGGEAQDFADAVEEAAQELERSVPRYWLYVVIAQSVALLGAAIAYSAPTCG